METDSNKIYFVHIRRYAKNKFGFTDVAHTGGWTIAARMVISEPVDKIVYTVARCSDKDHFNRKIGRKIAEGRLLKRTGSFIADYPSIKDFVAAVYNGEVQYEDSAN